MDAIQNAAFMSVGRSCGFAAFAIFCLMFGLSFDPVFATRVGGGAGVIMTAILLAAAYHARIKPYKQTYLWLMLAEADRPPEATAQRLVSEALREAYLWFTRKTAILTGIILAISVILQIVRYYR